MRNLIIAIVVVVLLETLAGTVALLLLENIEIGNRNYTSGTQGYVTFPIFLAVFHEYLHTLRASEELATTASIIGLMGDGLLIAVTSGYLDIIDL